MPECWREVPPTAGLPLVWRDLLPGRDSLEGRLAGFLGVAETQLECSGTAALIVALAAAREPSKRRKVVIPAYTCPLVPLAVIHCGLQPVLCDLRRDSFEFDVGHLAALCDDDTLAVVPTHLGGRVAEIAPVQEIAARRGALVIEDAAQALGARNRAVAVGASADIGFWSLAAGKGLTLYEGGVLYARHAGLRQRLRAASAAAIHRRTLMEMRRSLQLFGYWALYRPLGLRLVYGMPLRRALRRRDPVAAVGDDFPATIPLHRVGAWRRAAGTRALGRLAEFLRQLRARAASRGERLSRLPGTRLLDDVPGAEGIWPFFMLLMPSPRARDLALDRLWTKGLGVSRLFANALPDYGYLADRFKGAQFPRARDFAARLVTVSNSAWLEDTAFERVVSELAFAAERG